MGNLPQAFSHVPLVNTAISLANPDGPVNNRGRGSRHDSDSASDKGGGRGGGSDSDSGSSSG